MGSNPLRRLQSRSIAREAQEVCICGRRPVDTCGSVRSHGVSPEAAAGERPEPRHLQVPERTESVGSKPTRRATRSRGRPPPRRPKRHGSCPSRRSSLVLVYSHQVGQDVTPSPPSTGEGCLRAPRSEGLIPQAKRLESPPISPGRRGPTYTSASFRVHIQRLTKSANH